MGEVGRKVNNRKGRYDRQQIEKKEWSSFNSRQFRQFRCVRFDRQRHEGAGKTNDARRGDPCKHDRVLLSF